MISCPTVAGLFVAKASGSFRIKDNDPVGVGTVEASPQKALTIWK